MNISAHLLHRSLPTQNPTPNAYSDLRYLFANVLNNDIVFDPQARFRVQEDETGHGKGINSVAIDETEGRWMISGGADGSMILWDLENEDAEHKIAPANVVSKTKRPRYGVSSIRFNPNNSSLFTTTSYEKTLNVYSISSSEVELLTLYPFDSLVYSHSISPVSSEALIAVASSSPHIRLIDPRVASSTQTLFGHTTACLSVSWSPLYPSILASGSTDGTVRLWDIRYGASCLGSLDTNHTPRPANRAAGKAHEGGLNRLLWSSDGRRLFSAGCDHKIKIWELETGTNTNVIFPPVVRNKFQAEFPMVLMDHQAVGSGKGEMLWVGSEEQLLAFDTQNGTLLRRLKTPREEIADGVGRITGLASRGEGFGELFTCHTTRDSKGVEGRESISRWRSAWLMKDDEDVSKESKKTEKQKMLEDIFNSLTREPVRFG